MGSERVGARDGTLVRPVERSVEPRLRILHLVVSLGPANAQLNEHCLPRRAERDLSICSFHPRSVDVPSEIRLFEGDGTIRGFLRAARRALDEGPYDIVHAHAPGTATLLALVAVGTRRALANAVLTVHNTRPSFPLRNQALLLPLFAFYPTVVFCSRAAYQSFPAPIRALPRRRAIVPNGVDTARVDRAALSSEPRGDRFRIVSAGRLIPRKDPLTVLEAFRLASEPDDELAFIGDGALRTDVVERASRGGVAERVSVTGMLERDEVYRQMGRSDVYVSAARSEGLPVAVLEAMACGLPVILSDIPSHREIAADADFVPLVRPGDPRGFAQAIQRYRAMSTADLEATGRLARDHVVERFGLDAMHRSYERIYRSIMSSAAHPRDARPTREAAA